LTRRFPGRRTLGDTLQRLILADPATVLALDRIARKALKRAERKVRLLQARKKAS
jgi:hypothetical protein